jgi:GntR family transcriptional regulator/MocR family aminotransferase
VPSASGLHTIGRLAQGFDERAIVLAAARHNITVSAIERFSIAPIDVSGLVLGFGGVSPAQIQHGVDVLAQVLAQRPHA